MSADTIAERGERKVPRHRAAAAAGASTSIRVSVATRDTFAREAAAAGLSLTGYLDRMARRAEHEKIFAEFRAERLQAYKDPEFVRELLEWENMDTGIEFDDDGWPEFNE